MPNSDDGTTPGADDGANKSGTGDAAQNADDKSGKVKAGDEAGENAGQVVFKSQKELDDLIARRVNRATKDVADKAKLSETERLQKERDDALKLVADRDLKDAFISESGLSHAIASRQFNAYKDDIEVDEKGKPTNMKDVVKQLKADLPQLFKPNIGGKADGGAGSGAGANDGKPAGDDMNANLRRMAGRG